MSQNLDPNAQPKNYAFVTCGGKDSSHSSPLDEAHVSRLGFEDDAAWPDQSLKLDRANLLSVVGEH